MSLHRFSELSNLTDTEATSYAHREQLKAVVRHARAAAGRMERGSADADLGPDRVSERIPSRLSETDLERLSAMSSASVSAKGRAGSGLWSIDVPRADATDGTAQPPGGLGDGDSREVWVRTVRRRGLMEGGISGMVVGTILGATVAVLAVMPVCW